MDYILKNLVMNPSQARFMVILMKLNHLKKNIWVISVMEREKVNGLFIFILQEVKGMNIIKKMGQKMDFKQNGIRMDKKELNGFGRMENLLNQVLHGMKMERLGQKIILRKVK